MRVARWKIEHLTESEVLQCAALFFRFHDFCTSEDRDEDLLVCMCKPPYDTDLLSRRPQWKIRKEVFGSMLDSRVSSTQNIANT
jgi:hypothetical protein